MSKTNSLHYDLCVEGAKWLRRRQNYDRCKAKKPCFSPDLCRACRYPYQYVAVELCTIGTENTDVWGYNNDGTAVIEVKVSHADFMADQKKWSRSKAAELSDKQLGNYRYYLCPEGIIDESEIPDKWGLLVYDGKKIIKVKNATYQKSSTDAELLVLTSIMRREGIKPQIFNYRK